jgi:predicted ATPase
MVGRESELKALQDVLYTAFEDQEGELLTLVGEAGVGKSRLLLEFLNWVELLPEPVVLFLARGRQENQGLPFRLLRDLFVFRFEILEDDPPDQARHKFESGILAAREAPLPGGGPGPPDLEGPLDWLEAPEDRTAGADAAILGQLLGFHFSGSPHLKGLLADPLALRSRALKGLAAYFSALCARERVVVLLEDIHWADDSSLDALNDLFSSSAKLSLLVIAAARPGLFERRPNWGEGLPYHTRIDLQPLSKRDSRKLVAEILQKVEAVPLELRDLVVAGAEGNPFYLEELIKMMIDTGVIVTGETGAGGEERWRVEPGRLDQTSVPSTLTGVLQARLDSLPVTERLVLQQASIFGRTFWDGGVTHVYAGSQDTLSGSGQHEELVSPALERLHAKEMIFRHEGSAFSETREFIFKHDVLREVTYETVSKKVRRVYHALAADWLLEQGREQPGEYLGLIAGHLERAGRTGEAVEFFVRAGEQSLKRYANLEAAEYARRGLELKPSGETSAALLSVLMNAQFRLGEREAAVETRRQGVGQYRALGDLDGIARLYAAETSFYLPSRPKEAYRASQEGLAEVAGMPESGELARLLLQAGRACYFNGLEDPASAYLRRGLEMAERFGDKEAQADALVTIALINPLYRESVALMQRALKLSDEGGFLYIAQRAHNNLGNVMGPVLGDYERAKSHLQQAVEIARQRGVKLEEAFFMGNLGDNLLQLGDLSRAREVLKLIPEENTGRLDFMFGHWEEAFRQMQETMNRYRDEGQMTGYYGIVSDQWVSLLLDMDRFGKKPDWEEARTALLAQVGMGNWGYTETGGSFAASGMLSIVFARQGRIEEARHWLEQIREEGTASTIYYCKDILLQAESELAWAEKRWSDAIEALLKRLDLVTNAGQRWAQAHILLELGEVYISMTETGAQEKAAEYYRQSLALFNEIGATGYVALVERRLNALKL